VNDPRIDAVLGGQTVIVNMMRDRKLVSWARQQGLFVYVGRNSQYLKDAGDWGNPFTLKKDGDRNQVCEKHIKWLAGQPELLARIPELRGKVLGCYCKPDRCHGDHLAELANATK